MIPRWRVSAARSALQRHQGPFDPMKVDIILPIFRGERWICQAIESVLDQTYLQWHLTIVDDASPDNTVQRMEGLLSRHTNRLSLLRLDKNRGPSGARMEAISQTSGEVIAFIDQDDQWRPHKLELQIEHLIATRVAAVHTNIAYLDAAGLLIAARRENSRRAAIPYDRLSAQELSRDLFLRNSIRLASAAVLRRAFEAVGGFNLSLFGGEDWEFWVRFSTRFGIGFLDRVLVERRIHEANTSVLFSSRRHSGLLEALDLVLESQPRFVPLAGERRAILALDSIRLDFQKKSYAQSRRSAWRLYRSRPKEWRAIVLWGISWMAPLWNLLTRSPLKALSRGLRRT